MNCQLLVTGLAGYPAADSTIAPFANTVRLVDDVVTTKCVQTSVRTENVASVCDVP